MSILDDIASMEQRNEELVEENDDLQRDLERKKEEVDELERRVAELEAALEEKVDEVDDLEYNRDSLQEDVERLEEVEEDHDFYLESMPAPRCVMCDRWMTLDRNHRIFECCGQALDAKIWWEDLEMQADENDPERQEKERIQALESGPSGVAKMKPFHYRNQVVCQGDWSPWEENL